MDASLIAEFVKQGGALAFVLVATVVYFVRKEKENSETAKTVAEKLESSFKDREKIIQEANNARLEDQKLYRDTLIDLNAKLVAALNINTTTQEALADTVDSIRDKIEGIHHIVTLQQGASLAAPPPKKRGT